MRLRLWSVILACLVPLGTVHAEQASDAGKPHVWDGVVHVHGALRAMLHDGQRGATVTLDSLLLDPDLYALGALVDLSGEVTVIAGTAYLSYPESAETERTEAVSRSNAAATLLVAAQVPAWHALVTERLILFEELDAEIARLATAAGMRRDGRLPFLMQGEFRDLQWHVIDGRRLTSSGTAHADHQAAAIKKRLDRTEATLIGFYSERDQGVFTHMGTKTHIHCVVAQPLAAGHVDHVTIPAGTRVSFPVTAGQQPSRPSTP